MRLANVDGRAGLVRSTGSVVDVHAASAGRFGPDPAELFPRWAEFTEWVAGADLGGEPGEEVAFSRLGNPAPDPRQVFAIGLNYADHAAESKFDVPSDPTVFTKFASSLTGPFGDVVLPEGDVDWEVELVVVIGRGGRDIPAAGAWDAVAGLSVGQDLSERRGQMSGPAPQFSLAKSHRGFAPIGPALVTIDELDDPEDLELGATINGEVVQRSRTSQMVFPVPELIEYLSRTVELFPGDVLFTGTPPGVGVGRTPPRFLGPGDVLRSHVDGIGELVQTFACADQASSIREI
jgi:2,4-didehydro-3-deoxy-L-rhamnonate hydrolase